MVKQTCPGGQRLQVLLEEGEVSGDTAELVHHLESCLDCRETLKDLAAPPDDWLCTARGLRDEVRAETALHRLVQQMKEEELLPTESDSVSCLRPSDKPGVLGLLDRYEVQEEIGRGGMGVVFKARDPDLNRIVAIKVLSPWLSSNARARQRFIREAKAAAAVCHDHIVTVHAVEAVDGLPYLVMQYVAGESLQVRLNRAGPLAVEEVIRIGLQTATGLAAAHALGLIHRDIKPANLLLEEGTDRIKITDFGLARMADEVGLTREGVIAGTPEYMAPEQACGEVVDSRADLFSLGSVLYACCTGVAPFCGSTVLSVLRKVSEEEPAPIRSLNPDVPVWLEAFIARLMAKDPAQRFENAAATAAILEEYRAHRGQSATVAAQQRPSSPVAATSEPMLSRSCAKRMQRLLQSRWLSALVGLMVLGLSILLLAQLSSPEQASTPEPALREFYQDFRGGQPLHPSLALEGPDDIVGLSKPEAEGFRITLPAGRPRNNPAEVVTSFAVSGDFEITCSYELLSATRPDKGYGTGITLNIADSKARNKFAKVARVLLARKGSVFQSQYWVNGPHKDFKEGLKSTTSQIGKLRLVRQGPVLRCLAAEGLKGTFQEVLSLKQFGTEDMGHVLVGVTDSGPPGYAVDARLLDFKIRAANLIPDPANMNSLSGRAPVERSANTSGSMKWLAALGIMVLLVLSSLGVCLLVRRRRLGNAPSPAPVLDGEAPAKTAAPSITLHCSGCKKTLKVKPELAGKKIKCPQCGQTTAVPATDTYRAGKAEPPP